MDFRIKNHRFFIHFFHIIYAELQKCATLHSYDTIISVKKQQNLCIFLAQFSQTFCGCNIHIKNWRFLHFHAMMSIKHYTDPELLEINTLENAIYMAMQNPSAYIDSETGTSDEQAFLIQMKNVTEQSGKKVFLVVHIRQMHHIEMLLGYENSRRLLAEVGHYLTALCGKFCVFRNAEDTFTILLDEGKEEHIKGQIKKRFEQDFHVSGNSISLNEIMITLHYPRDFCSLAEYRALYGYLLEAAQNSGKQVFFEVDEAVKKDYYRRNKVEQAVDRAITENRFEVYYQPIYSLKEKCVVSLEALVRLKDEKLGAIPPDEFIPLAEQNGTITQISEIVLEGCCRFLAKHVLPNPSLGIRTIHVNIAAAQCLNRNLKESILPVLERYYVPAHMITLELTERDILIPFSAEKGSGKDELLRLLVDACCG